MAKVECRVFVEKVDGSQEEIIKDNFFNTAMEVPAIREKWVNKCKAIKVDLFNKCGELEFTISLDEFIGQVLKRI